jgi:hypothetical protein
MHAMVKSSWRKNKKLNIEYQAVSMPNTSSAAYPRSLIVVVIAVHRFRPPLSQAAAFCLPLPPAAAR